MSEEALEKIIKEKISADHLLYVSMKYTKTCDVIINLLKRWKIMIDYAFDGLLDKAKKKKLVKQLPNAPKLRIDTINKIFKNNKEVMDVLELYDIFRLIDNLSKTKEGEFRKGVCLRILYRQREVAVNLEKLKDYSDILERFINFVKLFILSK